MPNALQLVVRLLTHAKELRRRASKTSDASMRSALLTAANNCESKAHMLESEHRRKLQFGENMVAPLDLNGEDVTSGPRSNK
jgi:hypothetical protein